MCSSDLFPSHDTGGENKLMYEVLILGGIGGLVFVFVKNKFTKYENEING